MRCEPSSIHILGCIMESFLRRSLKPACAVVGVLTQTQTSAHLLAASPTLVFHFTSPFYDFMNNEQEEEGGGPSV